MLYRLMKKDIENNIKKGTLNYEDTQLKLDVFLARGRITVEQYEELSTMIEPYKPQTEQQA